MASGWRAGLPALDEHNQLPKVVLGAKFIDGLEVVAIDRQPQSRLIRQAVAKIWR